MEVHHHAHTARKKWTHYFWEFLMLFLAVFCGFLAENQREHIVEDKRGKEYAEGLMKDLQNDTAQIKKAMHFEDKTLLYIDSLVNVTCKPDPFSYGSKLYFYLKMAFSFYSIDWRKATINQLINSGNLRYFTNRDLANKISTYNTSANSVIWLEEIIALGRNNAAVFRDQVLKAGYTYAFNSYTAEEILDGYGSPFIDSLINSKMSFQKKDLDLLNTSVNLIIGTVSPRKYLKTHYYPDALNEAKEIMELLKKEYHLK